MEPQARVGLAQLTNLAFKGVDLHPLRSQLLMQCIKGGDCAGALMDLSVIDQLQGNKEQGLAWQAKAFETCIVFRTERGQQGQKKVLVFALPNDIGGNTPIEFLIPSAEYDIITYYPSAASASVAAFPLPDHDVAFFAAATDSPEAEAFSEQVRDLTRGTGINVINLTDALVKLDRESLQHRLAGIDGMQMPRTIRIPRDTLETALAAGATEDTFAELGGYPVLIRPIGSHAGQGLRKVCGPADLAEYLVSSDRDEFHLSAFIDYASASDGRFRKYRIIFVDGRAFPCHMAIAEQWDVWYLNADMQASAEKRQEEAAFMDQFDAAFGARHLAAFQQITARVGLDYFGIDCAEDRDGNLVVFEADNSLIVHDMDCDVTFPYKGPHMRRIFTAFETMLQDAMAAKPTPPAAPKKRKRLISRANGDIARPTPAKT